VDVDVDTKGTRGARLLLLLLLLLVLLLMLPLVVSAEGTVKANAVTEETWMPSARSNERGGRRSLMVGLTFLALVGRYGR